MITTQKSPLNTDTPPQSNPALAKDLNALATIASEIGQAAPEGQTWLKTFGISEQKMQGFIENGYQSG